VPSLLALLIRTSTGLYRKIKQRNAQVQEEQKCPNGIPKTRTLKCCPYPNYAYVSWLIISVTFFPSWRSEMLHYLPQFLQTNARTILSKSSLTHCSCNSSHKI